MTITGDTSDRDYRPYVRERSEGATERFAGIGIRRRVKKGYTWKGGLPIHDRESSY